MSQKYECGSCGATGLYRGFAERPGTAVVCITCQGTGAVDASNPSTRANSKPFTGIKEVTGVEMVYRSKGTFILNCGAHGRGITYQKFMKGVRP